MRPLRLLLLVAVAAVAAGGGAVRGYVVPNPERKWADGTIQVHEQITGGTAGPLLDGSESLNAAFENALLTWNQYLGRIQFVPVRGSTAAIGDGNGVNNIILAGDVFGKPFDSGVFALTTRWFATATNRRTEFDVVFNNAYKWNSYRGPWQAANTADKDIVRIALYEVGLALGLSQPDQNGQSVNAIMNSLIDLDTLTLDDISGAQSLYGTAPAAPGPSAPNQIQQFKVQTDADGVATFVPTGGRPFPVRFVDSDTGVGIPGVDAYLFTDPNGVGVAALRDRSGQYFSQMAPVRLPLLVTAATTPAGVRPIEVPVPVISAAPQVDTTPSFFSDLVSKDTMTAAFGPLYTRSVELFDAATATFIVEKDMRLDQMSGEAIDLLRGKGTDEGVEFMVKSAGLAGNTLWKTYNPVNNAADVRDGLWFVNMERLRFQGYADDQMFRYKVVRLIPTDILPAALKKYNETKIYATALEAPRYNTKCELLGITCPPPGSVTGSLTSATRGPITGLVTIDGVKRISVGSGGRFTSDLLEPGLHYISAGAAGHHGKGEAFTIVSGRVETKNFVLVPLGVAEIALNPPFMSMRDNELARSFVATALGPDKRPYTGPAPFFIWTSDNPAVATVDIGTGIVRPVKVGSTRISAKAMQMTGSAPVTVTRSAACTYTVTPPGFTSPAAGGTGTFTVATDEDCTWTAASQSSGLTLTNISTTAGNGTVRFSVAAHTGATSRTLSALIATKLVTITQAGTTPNPTPTTRYDGTYDFTLTHNVQGGQTTRTISRFFIVRNGAISSSDGTVSGSVTDVNAGSVRFAAPCHDGSGGTATWVGALSATTPKSGSGSYTCENNIIGGTWRVSNGT